MSNNKYSAFYCAIAKDEHFLEKPITLSCGHSICQQCIPYRSSLVTCGICGEINESDLNKLKESFVIKKLFSANLSEIFFILEERFYVSIRQLKENIRNIDRRLDVEIDFMKEEVEIQVESIKIELDKLKDKIYDELHECKQDFIDQIEMIEIEKYDDILKNFGKDLEDKRNFTESTFFYYQTQLMNLNKIMDNLKETDHHVMMKFNDDVISTLLENSDNIIGTVNCNYKGIKGRIKLGIFNDQINIKHNPSDICCLLSNGNILLSNYKSNNIQIYNSKFNLIKTIDKIANYNHSIEPFSITTNNFDKIYICEYNYVIMTDMDFNFIRKFGGVTSNSGANTTNTAKNNEQLDDPRYILFHDDHLYVCDCSSMKIIKLNSELYFKSSTMLDIKPRQIKIIDKIACIRSLNDGIYFYDIINFQLKFKYGNTNGYILANLKDNLFLQFRRDSMEIDFFDKNGYFLETINLKLIPETGFEGYFSIAYFNHKLIVHSNFKKLIII